MDSKLMKRNSRGKEGFWLNDLIGFSLRAGQGDHIPRGDGGG